MDFGLTSGAEAPIEFKLDKVGIFWASFAAIWTVLLVGGIAFLIVKRDSQILRIRGIALSICAVLCLHCYWVSVQFGYIVGYAAPGDSEYWIMGTWLPFGIALFHASNSRFLHIAKAQKRFVMQESDRLSIYKPKPKGFLMRFRRMDYTSKIFTLVGAGMVFQVGSVPICIPGMRLTHGYRYLLRSSSLLFPASGTALGAFPVLRPMAIPSLRGR